MFFIITGIVLGCSSLIIPQIISAILSITTKQSSYEQQLRKDIIDLRRQLQNVSMVDSFAAYAKLQRKINVLTCQYKNKVSERLANTQQAKFILSTIFNAIIFMTSIWIVWNYRKSPVVSLPSSYLWPFSTILALPSCQPGEISLMMWLALTRLAAGKFSRILNAKKDFVNSNDT